MKELRIIQRMVHPAVRRRFDTDRFGEKPVVFEQVRRVESGCEEHGSEIDRVSAEGTLAVAEEFVDEDGVEMAHIGDEIRFSFADELPDLVAGFFGRNPVSIKHRQDVRRDPFIRQGAVTRDFEIELLAGRFHERDRENLSVLGMKRREFSVKKNDIFGKDSM